MSRGESNIIRALGTGRLLKNKVYAPRYLVKIRSLTNSHAKCKNTAQSCHAITVSITRRIWFAAPFPRHMIE